jgi:threonine/homoserine/homoserine lactone efflux protein
MARPCFYLHPPFIFSILRSGLQPLRRLPTGATGLPAPAFAGGFLLAIANPKAYLAIAAVFAGTSIFGDDHALDAVVKVALLGVMIVIIHFFWLSAGASLSRVLRDPVSSRIVNVVLAGCLVVTTVIAALG